MEISLSNSLKKVIVDLEDYERVSKHTWTVSFTSSGNIRTRIGNKITSIGRFILNLNDVKLQVDHISGNIFDNRRKNLRICTVTQNLQNKTKVYTMMGHKSSSVYKGVSKNKAGNFYVRIKINWDHIYLGTFKSEIEAAKAYNKAAIKYFGEFARLNVLPEDN